MLCKTFFKSFQHNLLLLSLSCIMVKPSVFLSHLKGDLILGLMLDVTKSSKLMI
jgi:hypothetical protein